MALDAVFVSVLILLGVAAGRSGYTLGPMEPGVATVLTGLYVQSIGVLFLLCYVFPDGSYLLRALMWACENWGMPRGRWTAILWGVFCLVLGGVALLQGVGWIRL